MCYSTNPINVLAYNGIGFVSMGTNVRSKSETKCTSA